MKQVFAGVGKFSVSSVNAVAGTSGTNLQAGSAMITVNVDGAFFTATQPADSGRIGGGTDEAKAFILLHELAHLTDAAGFLRGDSGPDRQLHNNDLVRANCQTTLDRAAGRIR
jgi:hypothetical protein